MGFTTTLPWSVPATGAVKAMVCRQAAWPLWIDQTMTSYGYFVAYRLVGVATVAGGIGIDSTLEQWATQAQTTLSSRWGVSNMICPHVYPLIGVDQGVGSTPFSYIPAGTFYSIGLYGLALPAACTYDVELEIWNSPGETQSSILTINVTIGAGVTSGLSSVFGNATTGGFWIRPRSPVEIISGTPASLLSLAVFVSGSNVHTLATSAITRGVVTFGASTITTLVPAASPAEFANSALPWFSTRLTAVASLFTNVTQVLNKGGTALCGRISPSVSNPFQVTQAQVNVLHPAEKAFLALETGAYTFCPPSTDIAQFWDYTLNTNAGALPSPVYRLDNDAMVNHLFLTSAGAIETMAITLDWHIEFRTSSALFQVGLSTMQLETLHTAQIGLASIGFFSPNDWHKKLMSAVKPVLLKMARVGVKTVGNMHPIAKVPAQMILSRLPKPSINTTSAAKSGIVRAKDTKKHKGVVVGKKKTKK